MTSEIVAVNMQTWKLLTSILWQYFMSIAIIMPLERILIANHYYCLYLMALCHEHIYVSLCCKWFWKCATQYCEMIIYTLYISVALIYIYITVYWPM